MINLLKRGSYLIMFLFSLLIVPQIANAASPLDIITNQGEVIPYKNSDNRFSTPSQPGYQKTDQQEIPNLPSNLPPIDFTVQPRTVLGADDRRQVTNTTTFPYSAVVFVVVTYANGLSYVGSGAMISPDTVLTAGHVVYDTDLHQWAQKTVVYPAINGNYAPFGHANAAKLASVSGWINDGSTQHDIAMIRLSEPLGINTGWFGISNDVTSTTRVTTTGYPGDKPTQTMWSVSGGIKSLTDNNIFYLLDSYPGQSGSGVYTGNNQIVGVHAYSQETQNFGTRVNSSVLSWIKGDLDGVRSVYRLYNPNSGEHFYTASSYEAEYLKKIGWNYEGLAWFTPSSGNNVYRLYNPNSGDHHYTADLGERNFLIKLGWRYEGVSWLSNPAKKTPTYRLYNPNAKTGTHHYTISTSERDMLIRLGWRYEGISWYDL